MRIDELEIGTEVKFAILDNFKDTKGSGNVVACPDGSETSRGVCYLQLNEELKLTYNTLVVDSIIASFGQMIFIWTGVDACIITKDDKQYLMLVTNKYGLLYNRRSAPRYKVDTNCTVIFGDNSSKEYLVKDISVTGIGLLGSIDGVNKDDKIHLIFDDAKGFEKIAELDFEAHHLYNAIVVRTDSCEEGSIVGCKFCNNYKTPIFTIT